MVCGMTLLHPKLFNAGPIAKHRRHTRRFRSGAMWTATRSWLGRMASQAARFDELRSMTNDEMAAVKTLCVVVAVIVALALVGVFVTGKWNMWRCNSTWPAEFCRPPD